jgi:hypothetical protein
MTSTDPIITCSCTRLLRDLQTDARLAVDPQNRPVVFGRVRHVRDIPHIDRDAGFREDHQILDLLQVFELALRAQQE